LDFVRPLGIETWTVAAIGLMQFRPSRTAASGAPTGLAPDRFAPFNQKKKGVAQYLASLVDLVAGVSYIAKPTASEREVPRVLAGRNIPIERLTKKADDLPGTAGLSKSTS
jgi:hypothetical protein